MKKYPYIGQRYSVFILFYEEGEGVLIGDALGLEYDSNVGDKVNLAEGVDITHEYLQNTWGIVESKEHAEFIIEIAELHGFELFNEFDAGITHFAINKGEVIFTYGAPSVSDHDNQITIPLPPKEREWVPQVGGVVTWGNEVCNGEIKAIDGDLAWLKSDWGNYVTECVNGLKKPKSKQDLSIEELHQKLLANNCSDEYLLACDIVQGKIEGLSYE